jgi:hypothetical protein
VAFSIFYLEYRGFSSLLGKRFGVAGARFCWNRTERRCCWQRGKDGGASEDRGKTTFFSRILSLWNPDQVCRGGWAGLRKYKRKLRKDALFGLAGPLSFEKWCCSMSCTAPATSQNVVTFAGLAQSRSQEAWPFPWRPFWAEK